MRMNKDEVIKILDDLKLNKEEYWLVSSSALVMRDIYPNAGDKD